MAAPPRGRGTADAAAGAGDEHPASTERGGDVSLAELGQRFIPARTWGSVPRMVASGRRALAGREGFEPSEERLVPLTRLAGGRFRPLSHLPAEAVGDTQPPPARPPPRPFRAPDAGETGRRAGGMPEWVIGAGLKTARDA